VITIAAERSAFAKCEATVKRKTSWLYAVAYCTLAACVGAVAGAVAGVGVAGMLHRPEEAVVLSTGIEFGSPLGALTGIALGVVHVQRIRLRERK
jgi:membrane protein YqaA with SNARE-associated domain